MQDKASVAVLKTESSAQWRRSMTAAEAFCVLPKHQKHTRKEIDDKDNIDMLDSCVGSVADRMQQ